MARWKGLLLASVIVLLPTPLFAQRRDIGVAPPGGPARAAKLYENSFALLIGINDYRNRALRLHYAVNDARSVKAALAKLGFPEANLITLLNREATAPAIRTAFNTLWRKTGPQDRVVVFFAGHGVTVGEGDGAMGYLLPVEADPENVLGTGIAMDEVRRLTGLLRAKHVLFLADACYSGLLAARSVPQPEPRVDPLHLTRGRLRQVLTAGERDQQVLEEGGHGIFTKRLLEAFDGEADTSPRDGVLTAMEIAAFVQGRVVALSQNRQTPFFGTMEGVGQFVFELPAPPPAPPTIARPAPSEGPPPAERREEDRLSSLLARADSQVARQRLTSPKGDNAYETLQEVLKLDPANREALRKLRALGETYRRWAKEDLEKKNFARARGYYQRLLTIFPEDRDAQDGLEAIGRVEREEGGARARAERERKEAEGRADRERLARLEQERREREERERREREGFEAERRRLEGERLRLERERVARLEEERRRQEAERREREARVQKERELRRFEGEWRWSTRITLYSRAGKPYSHHWIIQLTLRVEGNTLTGYVDDIRESTASWRWIAFHTNAPCGYGPGGGTYRMRGRQSLGTATPLLGSVTVRTSPPEILEDPCGGLRELGTKSLGGTPTNDVRLEISPDGASLTSSVQTKDGETIVFRRVR